MTTVPEPEETDVLILCGGRGVRLQSIVNDRPKPMADINARPFLDILIENIASFGFKRFILCAGYKADYIEKYYKNRESSLSIIISKEDIPMGTAGALKQAEQFIGSNIFLAMNGDSFCSVDYKDFLDFHVNTMHPLSIALVPSDENSKDYGLVTLDKNRFITSFSEKAATKGTGYINGGIYFFQKKILQYIPAGREYSLEKELFPKMIEKGVSGYVTKGKFIDIGTPERYEYSKVYLEGI